ncbi:MAG: response regulator [Desulfuromonadaceae bacterium]|nr:response regulator [Desulfuromonadaceae bacterium]MDD2855284.1 response regulator [Desulfuromonadaceae bacterium]
MEESENFRILLLSGGTKEFCDPVVQLLLKKSSYLLIVETVEELLALPSTTTVEMLFVCHKPGMYDGVAAAAEIREIHALIPLVLIAEENTETLKSAVTLGACSLLEPNCSAESFSAAFDSCSHVANALRWEVLKHQQSKNRSEILMQSPFSHIFIDSEGVITALNREAARIMDLKLESTYQFDKVSARFFAPHALTYPVEMEMAVQSCSDWSGILQGRLIDLTTRVYRVISVPFINEDIVSGVLLTLHDITVVQNEKLRLLTELQAAHDSFRLLPASVQTDELYQMIFKGGDTNLKREVFSLRELLKTVASTENLIIPDYLPENFSGDTKRLRYALKALIGGSTSFGESGVSVQLSIKEHTPSRMTIQLNIQVKQSGILSDNYQSIRDYLATSCDVPEAATGLGLASLLIEQMKGTLLVRTERGTGRTVTCTIPLLPLGEQPPDKVKGELNADAAQLNSFKVLVAEDNLLEQTTLKHLLESIGCQAVIVSNGREAVDEFEHGEFDLILMDILMPVMDGFDATRLIRERERVAGGSIPVVALTSYSLKAIQEKCVSVGMNGYLAKPVAKNKLVEALGRIGKQQKISVNLEISESETDALPVLDDKTIMENLDNDLEMYRELIEMYLDSYGNMGELLIAKLAEGDIHNILECAHSLKGVASNIGGRRLAEVARKIQDICREGVKPEPAIWAQNVKDESAAFKLALGKYLNDNKTCK